MTQRFRTAVLFGLLCTLPTAAFAQKVWSGGGADTNWMTALNWVGGVAPVAGDALQFPDAGLQKLNNNNFPAGTTFASIAYTGTAGGYTLIGNGIILTGNVTSASTTGNNQITFDIQMTGTPTFSVSGAGFMYFYGVISGAGGINIAAGPGLIILSGANTYGGITNVTAGVLGMDNNSSLGAANGLPATGTVIAAGAFLSLGNFDVNVGNEALTLNGQIYTVSGHHTWAGPVTVGPGALVGASAGNDITLNGVVSGSALTVGGDGMIGLGNSGNNFSGVNWVNTPTLTLFASNAVPSTASLNIPAGATFNLNGFACVIAGLAGPGAVVLGTNGSLGVNQTSTTTFSGPISGAGGTLTKTAAGALTLSGTNSYTGGTFDSGGSLFINGTQAGSPVVVNFGATLGGTGTTGPINLISGNVAPGLSPGIINAGNTTLTSGNFVVELNGTTAGSGYDRLNVTGTVALNGAALSATAGFVPPLLSQFIIINNDGADPVAGTFAGLPQNAGLSISGTPFFINYFGGDGNDVVLVAGDAPAPVPAMGPIATLSLVLLLLSAGALALRTRSRAA